MIFVESYVSILRLSGISGIGVDIIEISRIKKAIESSGDRFLQKIFTSEERKYCEEKRLSYSSYAARFAAKEAALKAMGIGVAFGARFTDIEVYHETAGAPGIKLYNKTAKIAREKGIVEIKLSLSHDQNQAIAFAVALVHEFT